jgi:hypothetical protein
MGAPNHLVPQDLAAQHRDQNGGSSPTSTSDQDDFEKQNSSKASKEDDTTLDVPEGADILPDFNHGREEEPDLEKKISRVASATADPYLVAWESPDDKKNPRNWSFRRKWAAVFVVSSFTFICPVSSSMVAPALPQLSKDIGISSEFESQMVLSIFVLANGVGPILWGPLSEVFGRVRVLQGSNMIYMVFNLACGFAKTSSQMLAFRFLSGFGGSAMIALGGGILADCFVAVSCGSGAGFEWLLTHFRSDEVRQLGSIC